MKTRIYLDHNATTHLDPLVLQTVVAELEIGRGNPSSVHFEGRLSKQKLESSRDLLARYLKIRSQELIFTSGGTEGANLLIQGLLASSAKGSILTSNVEHSCVFNTVKKMETKGFEPIFLSPGLWGAVTPEAVRDSLKSDTRLICLMAVNNETGVKTDIAAIAAIAQEANVPLIVDAVALLGKEPMEIPPGVFAMFFSGHKLHAPKGVGAVFCRQMNRMDSLLMGGSQEFNHRAGSENLPSIVGFAKAVELLGKKQGEFTNHMLHLRNKLETGLRSFLDGVLINGEGPRVANTANISFLGVDGEALLMGLDLEGVSVSHGSACSSGGLEPSRILINMGVPLERARSAIRFSLSRFTTEEEIDHCLEIVVKLVKKMRR